MFKSDNPKVNITNMGWSTIVDTHNKLILHVTINVTKVQVDPGITDPDGVPLMWVEGTHVTRVRRMTEEEFVKYAREFGLKMEIDMHVAEVDKPKKGG